MEQELGGLDGHAAFRYFLIMYDNNVGPCAPPLGQQIRRLREARGWTLAELARRAATSGPTLHRYESGWDRFELATLRKIASALGARLDVRMVPAQRLTLRSGRPSRKSLVQQLSSLFWDRELTEADLAEYPEWVLGRVLMFGNRSQAAAVRKHFGDEAVRRAVGRRGIEARTRAYWRLMLKGTRRAPQGSRR